MNEQKWDSIIEQNESVSDRTRGRDANRALRIYLYFTVWIMHYLIKQY